MKNLPLALALLLLSLALAATPAHALMVELGDDDAVASNQTDVNVEVIIGELVLENQATVDYTGTVALDLDEETSVVDVEGLSLDLSPVEASFPFLLWTIVVQIKSATLTSVASLPASVGPDGSFTLTVQLALDAVVSAYLDEEPIYPNYPVSIITDYIDLDATLTDLGDTNGDAYKEFELLVQGPFSYPATFSGIPLIGEVSVVLGGVLDLGCSGQALVPTEAYLDLVSPFNGVSLSSPPLLDWDAMVYDVFRVYLVLPFPGYGYYTLPIWTPATSLNLGAPWFAPLWEAMEAGTWSAWVVLAVDQDVTPAAWELSDVRWFMKQPSPP